MRIPIVHMYMLHLNAHGPCELSPTPPGHTGFPQLLKVLQVEKKVQCLTDRGTSLNQSLIFQKKTSLKYLKCLFS